MIEADWMNVTFVHYEVEPAVLQPHVPFALDVREGRAYVSLVAFTQQKFRFAFGGALTAWAGALMANHRFLNVRTYVREGGIHFIAEWIPNRLTLWIAPRLYGLPCRLGRFDNGIVSDAAGSFACRVQRAEELERCPPGSLDEFLLERYVAFTERRGVRRRFRVTHDPWPQQRVGVEIVDDSLLRASFPWWPAARLVGANVSPGVPVTIGVPERLAWRTGVGALTRRWT